VYEVYVRGIDIEIYVLVARVDTLKYIFAVCICKYMSSYSVDM
jgi:hypothetical protein